MKDRGLLRNPLEAVNWDSILEEEYGNEAQNLKLSLPSPSKLQFHRKKVEIVAGQI